MNYKNLNSVFQSSRPSFLLITPICIFLGISTSAEFLTSTNQLLIVFILIGAVFAHISVNILNEYFDFKSGLDLKTKRTQFSGGSGALPARPEAAKLTLVTGFVALLITIVIGVYLMMQSGASILPIGLVGLVLIVSYTKWINRMPWLCLVAPGLGIGVLMVVGAYLVIAEQNSLVPWVISLVPFFLINNLLLLNQYPDMEADSSVGRRTFPIAYGTEISNLVYALFLLSGYSLIVFCISKEIVPSLSVIALFPIAFSLYAFFGAVKHGSTIGNYPKYLGANVAAATLTPLLFGIAIVSG